MEKLGHNGGHRTVLTSGELVIDQKVEGFQGHAQVPVAPNKILFVHGHGPTSVIVIEFQVVVKEGLQLIDLLLEILDLGHILSPRAFALDTEEPDVIDQLAKDLGLDMLEKIDFIGLRLKILAHNLFL